MSIPNLLLPTLLALAVAPAYAQCGGGHGGHGGHSTAQDHSAHREEAPMVHATNTICPVMGREVKPGRDREVVIRGNYYLVCCDGCGPDMSENYDKYLDKDGRPLNDPKRDSKAAPKMDPDKPTPAPPAQEGHQH